MASKVEDITIEYVDEGVVTIKELDKVILTKGAWATIIFKYQDWDKRKESYGPEKYSIRRYQKKNNEYRPKSKFNISSKDQAQKIIDSLTRWVQMAD
ncbi:MAG: hypothetical protein JSS07_00180 [Proteobacteria bacterium]|nr:hypothetical protein [Pseudomonadota bacterium]